MNTHEINSDIFTPLHGENDLYDGHLPPEMPDSKQTKKYKSNEDEDATRLKENKIARSSEPQLDLISGNPDLPDEDAIIFFITGDGFNKNEQNKFWDEATKKVHELLSESPFDEFQNDIKIYGYNVISKDSGARGDSAKNHQEALNDKKDTYFGSTFWQNGIERLLIVPPENYKKVTDLSESQLPRVDQEIVIVNSEKYGGSGGKFSVSSLVPMQKMKWATIIIIM